MNDEISNLKKIEWVHWVLNELSQGTTMDNGEIEQARDLEAIAIGYLAAIREANKQEIQGNPCNGLGIEGPVKFEIFPMQHNDRLMCIRCDFTLTYFSECQSFNPDWSQLVPPNAVPVPDYDLEDPNNP